MSSDVLSVGLDGVVEGKVRHEEEDEGREDALCHATNEHPLVEEQVEVTRRVELRIAQRIHVAHILRRIREESVLVFLKLLL